MELEGVKRCIQALEESGIIIKSVTTDRHLQIRAYMASEKPELEHDFDAWHMLKSIRRNIVNAIASTVPVAVAMIMYSDIAFSLISKLPEVVLICRQGKMPKSRQNAVVQANCLKWFGTVDNVKMGIGFQATWVEMRTHLDVLKMDIRARAGLDVLIGGMRSLAGLDVVKIGTKIRAGLGVLHGPRARLNFAILCLKSSYYSFMMGQSISKYSTLHKQLQLPSLMVEIFSDHYIDRLEALDTDVYITENIYLWPRSSNGEHYIPYVFADNHFRFEDEMPKIRGLRPDIKYDHKSVMHYPPTYKDANGNVKIQFTAKNSEQFSKIDQVQPSDLQHINIMYRCEQKYFDRAQHYQVE
uniref:Uncharacterized protein n=1 Tax=Ditylenchus dipsaci TaxID=166011 RepID=A0A915EN42_9BILA